MLLPNGQGWNEEKLQELFFECDVEDILRIPVGYAGTENYAAWNYTKNGIFSVKSAYHLNMQIRNSKAGRASSSLTLEEHQGWLALWGADVPGKAKIHVWRLIKNGHAVGQELSRRHIKDGVNCIVCNREETLLHRFWMCPHSRLTWDAVRDQLSLKLMSPGASGVQHRELAGWILDWLGGLEEKELTIGIMVLYQLWLARNDAREEVKIDDPQHVARRSIHLVEEWWATRELNRTEALRAEEHWLPPEVGWHKVNADGAFIADSNIGGCGVVLRNHHGEFISGASHFLTSVPNPERAEIIACKHAVELAKQEGVTKICLESDCLGAVSKFQNKDKDRSVHGPLVEEVKELLRGFADHLVQHVKRSGNEVAHILAREGCMNKVCNVWSSVPPGVIVDLLASEGAG